MANKKYLSEIFGYPPTNKSNIANMHREKYTCPFACCECDPINKKTNLTDNKGQLLLEHQTGACSAWYKPNWSKKPYPVIICPFRFKENNTVFKYIKEKFYNNENIALVPEIGLQNFGRADWLAVKYKKKGQTQVLSNISHVEVQSDATTGTRHLVECVKDFYSGIDVTKKTYNYGLNSKASIKGSSLQIIDKGFLFKNLGKNSIWIIQDYLFTYLLRIFNIKPRGVKDKFFRDKNIFFVITTLKYLKAEDKFKLEVLKCVAISPESMRDSISKKVYDIKEEDLLKLVSYKFDSKNTILL